MLCACVFVSKFVSAKPALTQVEHKNCLCSLEVLNERSWSALPKKKAGGFFLLQILFLKTKCNNIWQISLKYKKRSNAD